MDDQFAHHLHDTIILLGGRVQIANLLLNPQAITEADVTRLRHYNADLLTRLKDRLADINKMTIRTRGD